jgi:hypothetical protein
MKRAAKNWRNLWADLNGEYAVERSVPMELQEKLATRFVELQKQIGQQPVRSGPFGQTYDAAAWQQWATSAENLISAAFGKDSVPLTRFHAAYEKCHGVADEVAALIGVFNAAKADFEGGYLFRLDAQISGEVFGDFVGLAKTALRDGWKDVAAVLACAALEDALKRLARLNGVNVDDEAMQSVVGALKAKGLVSGAQKSLLDTMPKIRDYAMHANWNKITAQDVGSVIGFVEQLLLTHFS